MGDGYRETQYPKVTFTERQKEFLAAMSKEENQTSMHVTVVCGAGGRIGKALCKCLYQAGHKVIAWDIIEPNHKYYNAWKKVDLNDNHAVTIATLDVTSNLKPFDILSYINCTYPLGLNDHLKAYVYPTELFATAMMWRKTYGNIILFSSIYGHMIPRYELYNDSEIPEPPLWYGMSKAAIEYMTRYLAKKNRHVRINCIAPGGVFDKQDENFVHNYELHADMLAPTDLNKTVMWLLSEPMMTGQVITVDDGFTL